MTQANTAAIQQPQFETKDSGQRAEFSSGMQHEPDVGWPRFDLLVPQKYSERNWEKADSPAELERMKASAFRHFMQWFTGEGDEDHAAAVVFNLLAAETTTYRIEQQVKHGELGF
ncbi:dATP/dGTP diphosphohydrolase domain-containing protein [Streptomyces brevispora]|uniref:dATP/dGTP diphosphohydrolase domain-containing protein n=1 Tax=Streptomyces brevispora TaxID=887462 RepID=UPI0037FB12EE